MKRVHIAKTPHIPIKLEVYIDLKLADNIWLILHDRRLCKINTMKHFEYPESLK